MKNELVDDVLQQMLPYLDNAQTKRLQKVLEHVLFGYNIESGIDVISENKNNELVEKFIEAKRIEGCSGKTLNYYYKTIEDMLLTVGREATHIQTEDLRHYLTEYQEKRQLSRVTIDNVRRIFSSFFSWLEDEDYILKSPVRRIHKVKAETNIKGTYTDEELEVMRDSCENFRDLALISSFPVS